jgi:hypothetical protein
MGLKKHMFGLIFLCSIVAGIAEEIKHSSDTCVISDTTLYRRPLTMPSTDSLRFEEGFTIEFGTIPVDSAVILFKEILYARHFLLNTFPAKNIITLQTDCRDVSQFIKKYSDHVTMFMLRATFSTISGNKTSLQCKFAICQAPVQSERWNYMEVPLTVREQIKAKFIMSLHDELRNIGGK